MEREMMLGAICAQLYSLTDRQLSHLLLQVSDLNVPQTGRAVTSAIPKKLGCKDICIFELTKQ